MKPRLCLCRTCSRLLPLSAYRVATHRRCGERITERHDSCTECEDAAATRLSAIRVQARRAYRRARYRVACGVGVNARLTGPKRPEQEYANGTN